MVQLQLYIEGQQVELFDDESITLTQSIQDIKDISKVFTDFTRTFNVPASKVNNKIFKHFYNFNLRTYNTKTRQHEFYDARKKKSAELFLNYKPFKTGKIKFEGVSLKNNEPHTYKITFFGDTVNLKDILGEDKLSNLAQLNVFNFEYNDTNITTYLTNGRDVDYFGGTIEDAIIFPLITHSGRLIYDISATNDAANKIYNLHPLAGATSNHGVPLSELKPAIRLYAIIKAIENQVGYNITFSDDFFNSTNTPFYNLYMWLHNKEGALFEDQDAQYQITGFSTIIGDTDFIQGFTNKTFVSDYSEENTKRLLRVNVTPSGTASYNLVIKNNGEEFERFDNLTGVTTNGITNFKNENIEIPNGTFTFFIETLAVSSYVVDISIEDKKNGIFTQDKLITVKNAAAAYSSNKTVNINQIIPDMKVIDFITGLFKMFNLTAYQNESGQLVVKPLNEYYSSSTQVWDITKHLDKESTSVETVLPFSQTTFKYKGTGSFLANNHKQIANTEWGALEYKATEKYNGEVYTVELPFEHFKYEHLYTLDNGVLQTTTTSDGNEEYTDSGIQYGYSVDEQQAPYLGEPLIFYTGKSFVSIRVINLDSSANNVAVAAPYMPLNTITILNVFGFSDLQNLNFKPEYDEYTREVNQTTLFKTYYETYIKDMFDKRKRLFYVKAYLPLEVLTKLTLADKIIVFDDIYRINKITTNFENNLSELELTNIFEQVKYSTLIQVAANCLTVDTTLKRVDNNQITIDTDCERDFVIPDLTDNLGDGNDDNDTYDGQYLTVIAPTIAPYDVPVGTSTTVTFKHQITALGKLGDINQVDEYGFVYSTSLNDISSSDNVITLFNTGNVYFIPFTPANPTFDVPKIVSYELAGLTHPQSYYWRFYARTNTDPNHGSADAISSVYTANTEGTVVSQYGNGIGESLYDYLTADIDLYGAYRSSMTIEDGDNEPGIVFKNDVYSPYNTLEHSKQFMKWLTDQADPQVGVRYNLTHGFKYISRFGQDLSGTLSLSNITGAQAKIVLLYGLFPQVQIYSNNISGAILTGGVPHLGKDEGSLEITS